MQPDNKKKRTLKPQPIKISGKVFRGDQYGRVLGFPTANLERRQYARKNLKVKLGIWAGYAKDNSGRLWQAGIVIGPLDSRGLPKIEAHLIGFSGNLYGKIIILYLDKYLRPFKKYKGAEQLKEQIKKDLENVKKVLKSTNANLK